MTGQTQNAQNFAGFWPRLGSVATDWLILALALTLGNFLVMQVVHTSMSTNAFLQFFLYFLLPFSILVQILYFTWLNAGGRQSLGKKFFGIAVVNSSLLSVIAFILLIAIPAREILRSQIQAFRIPTGSLKPTLLIGDFILVDKHWAKTSAPERGDLIVFRYPQSPDLSYTRFGLICNVIASVSQRSNPFKIKGLLRQKAPPKKRSSKLLIFIADFSTVSARKNGP